MDVSRDAIEVHIEEVVLHGFAPGDRGAIVRSLEGELGRLLAAEGVPSALGNATSVPWLQGGEFDIDETSGPTGVGTQIARSVHEGLRQ